MAKLDLSVILLQRRRRERADVAGAAAASGVPESAPAEMARSSVTTSNNSPPKAHSVGSQELKAVLAAAVGPLACVPPQPAEMKRSAAVISF